MSAAKGSGQKGPTALDAKGGKPEVDLTHMPQYIKQAPWYID